MQSSGPSRTEPLCLWAGQVRLHCIPCPICTLNTPAAMRKFTFFALLVLGVAAVRAGCPFGFSGGAEDADGGVKATGRRLQQVCVPSPLGRTGAARQGCPANSRNSALQRLDKPTRPASACAATPHSPAAAATAAAATQDRSLLLPFRHLFRRPAATSTPWRSRQ